MAEVAPVGVPRCRPSTKLYFKKGRTRRSIHPACPDMDGQGRAQAHRTRLQEVAAPNVRTPWARTRGMLKDLSRMSFRLWLGKTAVTMRNHALCLTAVILSADAGAADARQSSMPKLVCAQVSTATASRPKSQRSIQTEVIADISSVDAITQAHVFALLNANGIEVAMGGSVVWSVQVPREKARLAVAILRDDATMRHYWIRFAGDQNAQAPQPAAVWEEIAFLLPYKLAISAARPHGSLNIKRILQYRKVEEFARKHRQAYVIRVRYLRREYLATVGTPQAPWQFRVGYEVEVDMGGSPDDKTTARTTISVQVMSDGRKIVP
jgi:hypothetical protein